MHEAERGEGARQLEARRRGAKLAQRDGVRRPARELAGDSLDARPAAGPDVPEDDSHARARVGAGSYGFRSDGSRSPRAALADAPLFVSPSPCPGSRGTARPA